MRGEERAREVAESESEVEAVALSSYLLLRGICLGMSESGVERRVVAVCKIERVPQAQRDVTELTDVCDASRV